MKAKINGIEFEGTPQEFSELLSSQNKSSDLKSTKLSKEQTVNKSVSNDPTKHVSKNAITEDYFPGTDEFIASLFRYKPSKTTLGRQSYVVQLLATGKTYTIRSLATKANTDTATVVAAIRRSVAADCVIQVSNSSSVPADQLNSETKVRMISLGTIERAAEVKEQYHKQYAELSTSKTVKTQNKEINTGSAPITKILYSEDR